MILCFQNSNSEKWFYWRILIQISQILQNFLVTAVFKTFKMGQLLLNSRFRCNLKKCLTHCVLAKKPYLQYQLFYCNIIVFQEEADFLTGTMLCLGAVLRSNQATPDEIGIACQKLVVISSKRQYLAVASIQLIVDHLPKISSEDFSEHVWPKLVSACAWKGSSAKIESLWLLLELNSAFPTIPSKSFLKEHFKRKKLISEELPGEIAEVLMVRKIHCPYFCLYNITRWYSIWF